MKLQNPFREIHFIVDEKCNLKCDFCWRDLSAPAIKEYNFEELGEKLIQIGVESVTIGGGEPLLASNLERLLSKLHEGNVKTRLHTNGMFLSTDRWQKIAPVVDYLALPIDSLDEETQAVLRGKAFIPTLKKMNSLASMVKQSGVQLGCHTVFTDLNYSHLEPLYQFLSENQFDSWRIFEFNEALAKEGFTKKLERVRRRPQSDTVEQQIISERNQINRLAGDFDLDHGGVNSLSARFLLTEPQYASATSPRVTFRGVYDPRPPHAFLYASGDIHLFTLFSQTHREPVGNIMTDSPDTLATRLSEADRGPLDDASCQDFSEMIYNAPLWKRIYGEHYYDEELEGMNKKTIERLGELAELHEQRMNRLWNLQKLRKDF